MRTLTTVYLTSSGQFTRETLAALAEVKGLHTLSMEGLQADPDLLVQLNALPRLQSLSLALPLSDETLQGLARLNGLTTLDLTGSEGFRGRGLKEHRGLRNLCLHKSQVTDDVSEALAGMKDLRVLDLSLASAITDRGIAGLKDLKHLTWLKLRHTRVSDAGLKQLPKQLTYLGPRELSGVTDAGPKDLRKLASLKRLLLNGTQVTAEGVAEFRKARPHCEVEK